MTSTTTTTTTKRSKRSKPQKKAPKTGESQPNPNLDLKRKQSRSPSTPTPKPRTPSPLKRNKHTIQKAPQTTFFTVPAQKLGFAASLTIKHPETKYKDAYSYISQRMTQAETTTSTTTTTTTMLSPPRKIKRGAFLSDKARYAVESIFRVHAIEIVRFTVRQEEIVIGGVRGRVPSVVLVAKEKKKEKEKEEVSFERWKGAVREAYGFLLGCGEKTVEDIELVVPWGETGIALEEREMTRCCVVYLARATVEMY